MLGDSNLFYRSLCDLNVNIVDNWLTKLTQTSAVAISIPISPFASTLLRMCNLLKLASSNFSSDFQLGIEFRDQVRLILFLDIANYLWSRYLGNRLRPRATARSGNRPIQDSNDAELQNDPALNFWVAVKLNFEMV